MNFELDANETMRFRLLRQAMQSQSKSTAYLTDEAVLAMIVLAGMTVLDAKFSRVPG